MEKVGVRLFDSHVHLLDYLPQDLGQVLSNAKSAGVEAVVCNTTHEIISIQFSYLFINAVQPRILKSFGIHPYKTHTLTDQLWIQRLQERIKQDKGNLVGQIGLDFRKQITQVNPRDKQMDVFDKQVKLACAYDRTMSVHCVRAHGEMLKYFKKLAALKQNVPNIVMHSYGGSKQITLSLLKLSPVLNIYFSLCQKRNDELCQVIPVGKLLFQTDAPFQLDLNSILPMKPKKPDQNQIRFIESNSVLSKHFQMDVPVFLNQIWMNSLKAFKVII